MENTVERENFPNYFSKETLSFLHNPKHSVGISFYARSRWNAQQKQIIHGIPRGDNNNYRS